MRNMKKPILSVVAPHAGAWIEISPIGNRNEKIFCRAPRGRVD